MNHATSDLLTPHVESGWVTLEQNLWALQAVRDRNAEAITAAGVKLRRMRDSIEPLWSKSKRVSELPPMP